MSDTKIRANLYIDGNFTFHIHKYLTKKFGKTIDWDSFQTHVQDEISKKEEKRCILKSQFFVGTGIKSTDEDRDFLYNSMDHAGIGRHATPLKQKVTGGLKEDAVDTNLVFHAAKDYYKNEEEQYDYLVLLAGDSDFVPLVKGLSKEAVKSFVIYWNFEDKELGKTQTAQALLDVCDIQENLQDLLNDTHLFKEYHNTESSLINNDKVIKQEESKILKQMDIITQTSNIDEKTKKKISFGFSVHKKNPVDIVPNPTVEKKPIVVVKKKTPIIEINEPVEEKNRVVVVKKKAPVIEINKPIEEKKPVVVVKKKANITQESNLPFTKEQLEKAIKMTQKARANSENEFVLVAQVGENLLCGIVETCSCLNTLVEFGESEGVRSLQEKVLVLQH